eukprot:12756379-Alexandrium_andersonii.AAC.1
MPLMAFMPSPSSCERSAPGGMAFGFGEASRREPTGDAASGGDVALVAIDVASLQARCAGL